MLTGSLLAPASREHGPDRRAPVTPITPRKVIGTTPYIEIGRQKPPAIFIRQAHR